MAAAKIIDFYWDTGSTNTYFALHLIRPLAAKYGARIAWHPFNLGHVFRHHDYVLMEEPAPKIANRKRDLARWAARYDLPFRFPDTFPIKTSRTLRGALAMRALDREAGTEPGADESLEVRFVEALFAAYWERGDATVADYAGMAPLVQSLGVDPARFEPLAESDDIRRGLIDSTDAGLARGVFGCPSFIIDDELYWGKDRMEFIADALAG